jgi:hypothetical protein
MQYRIRIWAIAGFLVANCWALYFAEASRDKPIESVVRTLAGLTQPIVLVGSHFHFGLHFYWVLLANAATYALIGLIVETLRQQLSHAK